MEYFSFLYGRFRQGFAPGLLFAVFAAVNVTLLNQIPSFVSLAQQAGWAALLTRLAAQMSVTVICEFMIMLALRMSCARASELVQHPMRFLLIMACACAVADFCAWQMLALLQPALAKHASTLEYVMTWFEMMLWGVLIAWLYLLYLQKIENRLLFSSLLTKRAFLARQIAQTKLSQARAQIDPELLTEILCLVHQHHLKAPQQAADLLDQLIAYLRLAMQRKRAQVSLQQVDAAHAELLRAKERLSKL